MNKEMCEHVASGQVEPLVTLVHKETGDKHSFCQGCLILFLQREGDDPSQFVIGYNVYQSTDPNLPKHEWKKLNDKPIPETQFNQDKSQLEAGKTYYSYMTAVNALGLESAPSEVASVTLPSSDEDEVEWPTLLEGSD